MLKIRTLFAAFVGCTSLSACLPSINRDSHVEQLLQHFEEHSQLAQNARLEQIDQGINDLKIEGSGAEITVSAALRDAQLRRVIERIAVASSRELVLRHVALGGRVTTSFQALPLLFAVNQLLSEEGLYAEVSDTAITLHKGSGDAFSDIVAAVGDVKGSLRPAMLASGGAGAGLSAAANGPVEKKEHEKQLPIRDGNVGSSSPSIQRDILLEALDATQALSLLTGFSSASSTSSDPTFGNDESSAAQSFFDEDEATSSGNSTSGSAATTPALSSTGSSSTSSSSDGVMSATLGSGVRAVVDSARNGILLEGPRAAVTDVIQTLRKLDVPTPHVLIEGLVVEFSSDDLEQLSSQFSQIGGRRWSSGAFDFGSILTPNTSFTNTAASNNGFAFSAAITALISQDKAKVISRPYIATLSRQNATVNVTRNRYVVTQQSVDGATISVPQPVAAGVVMDITPVVYSNGRIKMKLGVEDSVFIPTDENVAVEVDKNSAQSVMEVSSGESIVIGGLLRREESALNSGLPLLRHIPIINGIFGAQSVELQKREVVIFITPRVWVPQLKVPLPGLEDLKVDFAASEKAGAP